MSLPNNKDINGNEISEYQSISLRSISEEVRVREQFSLKLIKDIKSQTTYNSKNSVLFLNDDFWGMYAITEKFSSKIFESHYGISKEDIVFIKEEDIKEGNPEEYQI